MKKHILVVDTDRSMRILLQDLLEDEGHTVDIMEDEYMALQKMTAQSDSYDVIVLDLVTPRVSEVPFLQALSRHDKTRLPAIIVLSGSLDALHSVRALGIHRSLLKPFDLDALVTLIA